MEAAVESVQSDVHLLTDERDSIRRTFNDLTLKLIHSQVYSVQWPGCTVARPPRVRVMLVSYALYELTNFTIGEKL